MAKVARSRDAAARREDAGKSNKAKKILEKKLRFLNKWKKSKAKPERKEKEVKGKSRQKMAGEKAKRPLVKKVKKAEGEELKSQESFQTRESAEKEKKSNDTVAGVNPNWARLKKVRVPVICSSFPGLIEFSTPSR